MNFRRQFIGLSAFCLLWAAPAAAIDVAPETLDCENPGPSQAPIGPETSQERTARLNREFELSLQYFDRCIAKISQDDYASSGGSGGSGGGSGSGQGGGSGSAQASSQGGQQNAESGEAGQEGTEAEGSSTQQASAAGGGQGGGAPQHGQSASTQTTLQGSGSGAVPSDIPGGDDDDIVAAQLRQAALETTDPVAREKLWDDYRKYKGID